MVSDHRGGVRSDSGKVPFGPWLADLREPSLIPLVAPLEGPGVPALVVKANVACGGSPSVRQGRVQQDDTNLAHDVPSQQQAWRTNGRGSSRPTKARTRGTDETGE